MENKKKYYKWTQENLDNALLTYREGRMGLNECSRQFGISKPTLKRHFKKMKINMQTETKPSKDIKRPSQIILKKILFNIFYT
jgi:DNA invertase Pin-like site-specific DNA recombinase